MDNPNKTPDNAKYCYRYPHPAVTADCVIFGFDGEHLKILLVERGVEPYLGQWALPGGFMNIDETIEQTAQRELREETGLERVFMQQFKVYSTVDRDPRERVVTVAFVALVRHSDFQKVSGGDDARLAAWFNIDQLPPLAFDHETIIAEAREYLTEIIRVKPIAFTLLNETFTMSMLQKVYEVISGVLYDRRNFQRKVMQTDIVEDCGVAESHSPSRPPKLYALSDRIKQLLKSVDEAFSTGNQPNTDSNMTPPAASNSRDADDIFPSPSTRDLFNF